MLNVTATTTHRTTTKNILDLKHLFESGHLNLNPGFQRQSVWTERGRAKLIESIIRNYPLLPSTTLYQQSFFTEEKFKGS
jgi:hypothetical protein